VGIESSPLHEGEYLCRESPDAHPLLHEHCRRVRLRTTTRRPARNSAACSSHMVPYWLVARIQVLVQLDDELLSLLDERAAAAGVSRSEMVRRGVRAVLAADVESKLDEAIAEGYKRIPAAVPDTYVERLAVASIEQEPW
jgi:Ribbon-helix-helix protein, copG family